MNRNSQAVKVGKPGRLGRSGLLALAGILEMCLAVGGPIATAQAQSAAPDDANLTRCEFERVEMAVPAKLILYARDERSASSAAEAALNEIHRLTGVLSDYDADSELRRLCRRGGPGRPVPVSNDLWRVLSAAQDIARRSNGAFDVTVGPVVRLWRRARRRYEYPPVDMLQEARGRVGFRLVRLHEAEQAVELLRRDMRLDLGGIAKGYAADAALNVLRTHGVQRALIDLGGDIRVGDPPPGQPGWRIGVAAALPEQPSSEYLSLSHAAIATSGDAWQHVEIDGVRYSHIVDPRTGVGLTDRSTVTVVAPTGMLADGLASAVSVLGPAAGFELLAQFPGTAARMVRIVEHAGRESAQIDCSPSWSDLPRADTRAGAE